MRSGHRQEILLALKDGPMTALDLVRRTGALVGTIYSALRTMEADGIIISGSGRARKFSLVNQVSNRPPAEAE